MKADGYGGHGDFTAAAAAGTTVATEADDATSNVELAYTAVREAILRAELAPGSVISQVQLAQAMGVSRTPLREALRMLQHEGLVNAEHQRRVRIAELSIGDLEELYALRIAVETLAIRISVPRLSADDRAELRTLLGRMEAAVQAGDVAQYEAPHRQFHFGMYRHAGDRINKQIGALFVHAERYRRAYIDDEGRHGWKLSFAEHQALLDHCDAGRARAAAADLARHLARTALGIILHDAPEHEPATVRAAVRAVVDSTSGP